MGVVAALALCRFGTDAAALMLWGASAYLLTLVPRGLASEVADRLRRLGGCAIATAVLSIAARLPAEAAAIGSAWHDAADPAMLHAVLAQTSAGLAWQAQVAGALLLLAALRLAGRARLAGLAAGSALVLAAASLTGHAVMQEGTLGLLHRGNDILHLLAGGAWLGSLVPMLLVLDALPVPARRRDAIAALRRFSRMGHVAVGLVLVSGAANVALTLGRWPTDAASPYDRLLDLKIVCVLAMVGLALVNRYVLVPRLGRGAPALARLRRCTLAELPLGFAAIALVAVFGLLDPG